MKNIKVAIMGGSGLDDPDLIENRTEKFVTTPYGNPSDALIIGKIKGVDCVLLARHGRKHSVYPTGINYRANIWALKQEGCTHIVATSACGSLQEKYAPGNIVFLNDFIDRTTKREQTFFDGKEGSPEGVVHLPMHTPFCPQTRKLLMQSAQSLGHDYHEKGTYLAVEGPRFSSVAESKMFQSWGAHVIGMTAVPEVMLANELSLCYATIALVTDYDSWRDVETHDHVNVQAVLQTFKENAHKAHDLLLDVIPRIAAEDWTEIIQKKQAEVEAARQG